MPTYQQLQCKAWYGEYGKPRHAQSEGFPCVASVITRMTANLGLWQAANKKQYRWATCLEGLMGLVSGSLNQNAISKDRFSGMPITTRIPNSRR